MQILRKLIVHITALPWQPTLSVTIETYLVAGITHLISKSLQYLVFIHRIRYTCVVSVAIMYTKVSNTSKSNFRCIAPCFSCNYSTQKHWDCSLCIILGMTRRCRIVWVPDFGCTTLGRIVARLGNSVSALHHTWSSFFPKTDIFLFYFSHKINGYSKTIAYCETRDDYFSGHHDRSTEINFDTFS